MPIFYTVEVRAFADYSEDEWHDITDRVVGEVIFREGREVDSLGGVLPTTNPSTLSFAVNNQDSFFSKPTIWRDRLSPGAVCRLRIGGTTATGVTRFIGTMIRRDSQDDSTYITEWSNDLFKISGGRNNKPDDTTYYDKTIQELWELVCIRAGVSPDLIDSDSGFGRATPTLRLEPGLDGIEQIQDISGGSVYNIIRNDKSVLYLESPDTRYNRLINSAYYEPGGSPTSVVTDPPPAVGPPVQRRLNGVAVPKIRDLTAVFGVVNALEIETSYLNFAGLIIADVVEGAIPNYLLQLGEGSLPIIVPPGPGVVVPGRNPSYWGQVRAGVFRQYMGIRYNIWNRNVRNWITRYPSLQVVAERSALARNLSTVGLMVTVAASTIATVFDPDHPSNKATYTGRRAIEIELPGLIQPDSVVTFSGWMTPVEEWSDRIANIAQGWSFEDEEDRFQFFSLSYNVADRTITDNTWEKTFTWNYDDRITLGDYTTRLTISDVDVRFSANKVYLIFSYSGGTFKGRLLAGNYSARTISIGGAVQVTRTAVATEGKESKPWVYTLYNDTSIAKYGRRERPRRIVNLVPVLYELPDDFVPGEDAISEVANLGVSELAKYAEPLPVFQVRHDEEAGIIARRLGDKERLELERGSFDLFVENIETHFSGVLAWQVVSYANPIVGGGQIDVTLPPDLKPFTATATYNQQALDVVVTDYDSANTNGDVTYTLEAENQDGSKTLGVAKSSTTTKTATYTFASAETIERVRITRQSDDYQVVIEKADFLGTLVVPDTYPDFTAFARWSNEQLIVGITENRPNTQPNYGNNNYRIAWYGGVPGQQIVTTNTSGAASYTITTTFGITSLRITQLATGITKVVLAKDFGGMGYVPRAFTTQWTKITGSNTNYFYYRGWIQDHPSSVGGLAYSVAFEDVTGIAFTWEARVVSDSTGRATPGVVGHTRAISVMIITRLIDGHVVRFPFPNVNPPTGGDELAAYNFTATWNQRSLVLRVQERGPAEDVGSTEFRLTSSGLSPELNVTRTTSALGAISYTINDASSIQSVTATRTGDNDSVTILRANFYGTYIAPAFRTSISEVRTNGSPDRYTYSIGITDAAGVNTATPYRIEGTFAKFRQFIFNTTSANSGGTWRAVVTTRRHSQGFSNITVTRLTDNTLQSIARDNFNRKASNNPQFSVVVDEDADGTRQGIQLYSYAVLITDPSSTAGGGIYYKVEYVQGGTTLEASEVQTARNGEVTVRFGTERTTASSVKVTRDWDGRVITVPRSSFNRE